MHQRGKERIRTSIRVLQLGIIVLCLIIIGRLVQLQIIDYDKYSPLSRENSLRQEIVNPARGLMYDRNGRLLVDNEPIYTITVTPATYNPDNTPLLAQLMDMPLERVQKRIDEARAYSWYRASRLFTEVDFSTFSTIQENIWRLPGISHQIESKRDYPVEEMNASHIFGYLREVSEEEYLESGNYHLGDKVGKSGLEMVYEDHLRGELGVQYTRINALGQSLGPYEDGEINETPVKGDDLFLTIDADLQVLAEDLMEDKRGAVVAIDPSDGAVLSLVSSPQYDIRRLAGRIDSDYWQTINTNIDNPLYNRAISTRQPPGSTFKPLMGLIGLELGLITPNQQIYNPGYFYRGRRYHDLAPEGEYDLEKAIENSSNTYFFWLMNEIADNGYLNRWKEMTSDFGLGRLNNIDLPFETRGLIPDSSYFNSTFGERRWGVGDLISLGVGQGLVGASPLQMAVVAASIGNEGHWVQPHLVSAIRQSDGTVTMTQPGKEEISWLDNRHIQSVKNGMRRVVTEGSGRYYANLDSIEVAGKTGTAQNPHGTDHGWFITFAPVDDPEIAIAVLVENSGYGSISAAPIASLLTEQYLTGEINRPYVYDYVKNFEPEEDESLINLGLE